MKLEAASPAPRWYNLASSELLERAARGEEITITRRGEPVARLVPPADASGRDQAAEAVAALRQARRGVRLEGAPLRELIEEGRR